ncbi:hypothetical protein KM043_004166 [Ampulex compressa]|nr:hypothetical protein KM043_004166 [Ampulex compressa]
MQFYGQFLRSPALDSEIIFREGALSRHTKYIVLLLHRCSLTNSIRLIIWMVGGTDEHKLKGSNDVRALPYLDGSLYRARYGLTRLRRIERFGLKRKTLAGGQENQMRIDVVLRR